MQIINHKYIFISHTQLNSTNNQPTRRWRWRTLQWNGMTNMKRESKAILYSTIIHSYQDGHILIIFSLFLCFSDTHLLEFFWKFSVFVVVVFIVIARNVWRSPYLYDVHDFIKYFLACSLKAVRDELTRVFYATLYSTLSLKKNNLK